MSKLKIDRCVLCGPKKIEENIAHFSFPKDRFHEWKLFCTRADPNKLVFVSSKLCCMHFKNESFTSLYNRHMLKKDAIPSLISNNSESIIRKCNHNLIERKPVEDRKNYAHQSWKYCLLCKSKRTGVGTFGFPKEDNIRNQWIDFCQIDITKIHIHSRICQYHFTDDDFYLSNCGRVNLKTAAIPSIRVVNVEECKKKKEISDADSVIPLGSLQLCSKTRKEDTDNADCPPKRLQLCSEIRYHEPICLLSCENGNISSTHGRLELKECSFCKLSSVDVVQFRFSNNTAMRLFMQTKCGMSSLYLDTSHTVCICHFDSDDIDVDNDGKKSVKDRAFPWCYFSQMIANSSGNISPLPILTTAVSVEIPTCSTKMNESSDNISCPPIINSCTSLPSAISLEVPNCTMQTNEGSHNISHFPVVNSHTELLTPVSGEMPTCTAQLNGIVRPTRKRKAYVGDMTPSDFKTPQSVQKNLMFIKNKFRDVSVKVKKLQDQNRWANRRVKKILDSLETLNAKGLISNNVLTTVHKFTHNLIISDADCSGLSNQ